MKRFYVSPLADLEEIEVSEVMLATSVDLKDDEFDDETTKSTEV